MAEDGTPCCEPKFWVNLATCVFLVVFAGLTSGLSLGLLSHSKVELEVLIKAGLPQDKKNAAKVLPIIKNECFLLCTLLIDKSLATEALPIFLDKVLPFWFAILISVALVVAFVEVIPQAVCSRHGLSFGAQYTLFVRFLLFFLYPVAYPISKVLDWFLGKNRSSILRRAELRTLVDFHGIKAGKGGDLIDDETTIISGALGMVEKFAKDAMTPLSKAFSLDINSKLDMHTMKTIASKGHSRIPVYSDNPANIIGLIMVKNLIFYHPDDETPLKSLTIKRVLRVYEDWPLYDVMKLFQEGHGHMAVVVKSASNVKETFEKANDCSELQNITVSSNPQPIKTHGTGHVHPFGERGVLNISDVYHRDGEIQPHSAERDMRQPGMSQPFSRWERGDGSISTEELEYLKRRFADEEVIGIITMEDVLEELLQEEILDETDQHVEIHDTIRVKFVPSTRSSFASSGRDSVYQQNWRTPATSASSSYHTPLLPSPILPYVTSPLTRPVISSSPGRPTLSTSRSVDAVRSARLFRQFSAVSRQVSVNSNEAF